jgi:hypothetical protein
MLPAVVLRRWAAYRKRMQPPVDCRDNDLHPGAGQILRSESHTVDAWLGFIKPLSWKDIRKK